MSKPLSFDDIKLGDTWTSQGRTVTETDIVNFAGMTGDYDPLHVDHEFASTTPFGKPIAHGLLGLSFVAGLGSQSPRMQTLAFVAIREWQFLKPTYIGDTVHVRTEVMEKTANGRRTGRVVWKRELLNQSNEVVQSGVFETLVCRTRTEKKRRIDAAHQVSPPNLTRPVTPPLEVTETSDRIEDWRL